MKILMVGHDKGAWQMRGVQLGHALGARVTSKPQDSDVQWADVVVLVKKAGVRHAPLVHRFGKPLVWDALDFWEQPEQNGLSETEAVALLREMIRVIHPTLVIGATARMAEDAGGVYLPHHSWQGLVPTPPRARVEVVAYQGNPRYLGRWRRAVHEECHRRGWVFLINPIDLRVADLLVAFRDGKWNGWMCQNWKSDVKGVNAFVAGRPIITSDGDYSAEAVAGLQG